MKLGIHLTGTAKGTVQVMGMTKSKTLTVDHWLLATPAEFPSGDPLFVYDLTKANLLPEGFHVGGGQFQNKTVCFIHRPGRRV